jgi:hypothetical protein
MGWRRETWALLTVATITVVAFFLVSTFGAAGVGLVECRRWDSTEYASPFGPCGDALATIAILLLILVVGGLGLLVATVVWLRSRRVRLRCMGCRAEVAAGDATCPGCGRDLQRAFGPPSGWGTPRTP